jgi:secondary thiamine-phosphate synthase enzyme
MATFVPTSACCHETIRITSPCSSGFVDLTDHIHGIVARARVDIGLVSLQTRHTTTAVVVNEAEPGLLDDFQALLERLAPRDRHYEHDDPGRRPEVASGVEPVNGHAHCRSLLLPSAAAINIADGRLDLGRWQRVFLVELDGPREREVSVVVLGAEESRR